MVAAQSELMDRTLSLKVRWQKSVRKRRPWEKGVAEKIQNLLEEMPNGDDSDFGDLTDSDDEYLPDIGKGVMADPTVQENSDDSSEDEAEATDTNSDTGSVDRGHWRKRLLKCSLPHHGCNGKCLELTEKHINLRHFQASVAEAPIAAGKQPVGRPSLSQQPATKKRKAAIKPPENNIYEIENKLRMQSILQTISTEQHWECIHKQAEALHPSCNIVVSSETLSKKQDAIPILV
ncbi:hypothetical protein HPB50_006771 [Hyalomma asiaticum]|uniref:Uncharacterized protein n=1 Tax=Hyalomma asiaticum TaxID=266040 RepID=A0ACB7SP51_HYAAI|nr:hypothetical protein HPB50_006771 [Hyalomma asiaticum]